MTFHAVPDEGGPLPIGGWRVTQCSFDYATTLLLGLGREHYLLRLQTEFSLTVDGKVHRVEPEDHSTVAVVLSMFNQDVARAHCSGTGALSIEFVNGDALAIEPDPRYEAWILTGPKGFRVIALPGGGLALWDRDESL